MSRIFRTFDFSMDPSQCGTRDYYQEWDLDGLGNWTAFNDNSLTPESRTHSEYNEIVTVPGITQNHDKNGNLRSDGTLLYFWDAFNRLKYIERISDNMVMGEFLYDAQNRRVFHTAPFQDAPTYGNARRYVYSGPQLIAEYFKPYGEDEHLLEQYAYGVYLDEVWARQKMIPNVIGGYNIEYLYFHHDTLYNVCGVSDLSGNFLEAYEYDPYGRRIVITDGPDPDSIVNFNSDDIRGTDSPRHVKQAFTGQIYDEETGLYYYKERYYHPGWGRFISRDPVISSDNFYQYCRNNPVLFLDTLGLMEKVYTATVGSSGSFFINEIMPESIKRWFNRLNEEMFQQYSKTVQYASQNINRFRSVKGTEGSYISTETGVEMYYGECIHLADQMQKLLDFHIGKISRNSNPSMPYLISSQVIHKWAQPIGRPDHWSAILMLPTKIIIHPECKGGEWRPKIQGGKIWHIDVEYPVGLIAKIRAKDADYTVIDPQKESLKTGPGITTVSKWLINDRLQEIHLDIIRNWEILEKVKDRENSPVNR